VSRATADLDLVVEARGRETLISFLESLGYETLHASAGYSNHLHAMASLGRVDCIYAGAETAERLFEKARIIAAVEGIEVRVPCAEHLCAMKCLAMKNDPTRALQDMADVQRLLELPQIDEDQVRGYFERHGLMDAYREIKKRTRPA
jgi:hypothetical protein